MPSKKKKRQDKQKKRGGETVLKFAFLHASTSQANILHLDQKAARSSFVVSFIKLFIARQWLEDCSTSFKKHFLAKIAGGGGGGWVKQVSKT